MDLFFGKHKGGRQYVHNVTTQVGKICNKPILWQVKRAQLSKNLFQFNIEVWQYCRFN